MDKEARITYNMEYNWMGSAHAPVLPGEKWVLYIEDKKITKDLQILYLFYEDNLTDYIKQRHSLSEAIFHNMNWRRMHKGLSKFTDYKRAMAIKMIHGWLPTNT